MAVRNGVCAALALAACGRSPEPPPIDAARLDAPNLGEFPAQIVVSATQATIANAFRVDANGAATVTVGAISISGDAGTVELDGANVAAFVYQSQSLAPYTLFQGFAVDAQRWDIFWLYCNSGLVDVYDEGIGGPFYFSTPATGSCVATTTATTATVDLPALSITTPAPSGGYTVTSNVVTVNPDGTGALVVAGSSLPLVVFDDIDCTSGCGTPGWYELHSLAWDTAQQRVVFLIVYLVSDATSSVTLAYARSLPDLGDPIGTQTPQATWSAHPTAGVR